MSHPLSKPTNTSPRDSGMSLLEVMIVLAVIALIMGLVTPRVIGYFGRAKSQTAELQLTHIKGALQLMYIDLGRYPSESEGLDVLLTAPAGSAAWEGPYLDTPEGLTDPWGRRYLYRFPGSEKPFDLSTLGRDGQSGGTGEDTDISL